MPVLAEEPDGLVAPEAAARDLGIVLMLTLLLCGPELSLKTGNLGGVSSAPRQSKRSIDFPGARGHD
jgi:hypothetical protein